MAPLAQLGLRQGLHGALRKEILAAWGGRSLGWALSLFLERKAAQGHRAREEMERELTLGLLPVSF